MRKLTTNTFLIVALVTMSALACAHNRGDAVVAATADAGASQQQQRPAVDARQSFIAVEGADLKSKSDAAAKMARSSSSPKTPFWTAYTFDVRPGVAVDPNVSEFHGSMMTEGGTNVFVGTSNGVTVETRNLGVFLLREASGDAVKRIEIYNLERRREYSGHPVYWLGRAGNEESLNYLRGFAESNQPSSLNERATLAIALHDAPGVSALLKNYARGSASMKVRSTSIFWLGQIGGETSFLAELVRNEREDGDLRRHAAHAIGESKDKNALDTLLGLYDTVANGEVKKGIIHAVAENENKDAAFNFLLKVAKTDADRDARKHAIHQLGETNHASVVEELMKIFAADRDEDTRRQVIHALSETENPRAEARLLEIARGAEQPDVRRHAIHQLGEKNTEPMVDELMKLYQAEQDSDVKRHILHAFSEMSSPRAQSKLLEVARNGGESADVRRQAIHWLGEKDDAAGLDELVKIYDSERDSDVRRQILHALSEMESPRAEDKLFEIARRGDDPEMRKQAIHRIGERAGKRSLDMLSETVDSTSAEAQVQIQAVRAISERPDGEAVPLLIKIAKTHPNAEVRKHAIRQLGESGDPRAVEYFGQILKK